jgi:subtilisin-like proprotein convertase family protein
MQQGRVWGLMGAGRIVAALAMAVGWLAAAAVVDWPPSVPAAAAAISTFTNPTSIAIPAVGSGDATGSPAGPYPSTMTVSGVVGTVAKVTVSLQNISHTFPDDIDVIVVGPGGQIVTVMSDAGHTNDLTGATLTFDDGAASALPDGAAFGTGTYKPSNYETVDDPFPAPAPVGSRSSTLSVFNGVNPNGTWRLYVVDDAADDIGSIASGWSLTITSVLLPTANGEFATTVQGTAVVVPVLANDSDPDGTLDPATVAVVSGPASGSTSVNTTTGAITYVPNDGFSGMDSFSYTVRDNDGAVSNAATVSVTVNPAPTPTLTPTPTSTLTPTLTPTFAAGPSATPVPVRVSVQRAGANRLLVTIAATGPIDRVAWPAVPNVAVETVDGTPITGGVLTVPASSITAVFYIRKLSGSSVTLPLTVTGAFGTWQTFVGGGPNAW